MKVYRKAATAEWHHENAEQVDDVKIKITAWTQKFPIRFDGTKDKSRNRFSDFQIELSESEIE